VDDLFVRPCFLLYFPHLVQPDDDEDVAHFAGRSSRTLAERRQEQFDKVYVPFLILMTNLP
jgi:hypothetical protein